MSSSTSLAGAFLLKRRRANVESRFDRFLKSCRDNLYLVLFAMAKEGSHSAHTKISIAAMLWDALQLLAYPLYYSKKFPWYSMPNMKWLITILSFVNPSNAADSIAPWFKITLLVIACVWTALSVSAMFFAAWSFAKGDFSTVAPLRFLRGTAKLTASALFVPFATILISVFRCSEGGKWSVTDISCYSGTHEAMMAVVVFLLPLFWFFTLVISATFFDRDYSSDNITARPHGRVAIAMITIKTALTLLFSVLYEADTWILLVLTFVIGFFWLWLWIGFLPNYQQAMNRWWAAFGAVFAWASCCAILAKLLDNPSHGVAGWCFLSGAIPSAYAGYSLAAKRFDNVGRAVQPLKHMLETREGLDEALGRLPAHVLADIARRKAIAKRRALEEAAASRKANGLSESGDESEKEQEEEGDPEDAGESSSDEDDDEGAALAASASGRSLFGLANAPSSPYEVELRVRFLVQHLLLIAEGGGGMAAVKQRIAKAAKKQDENNGNNGKGRGLSNSASSAATPNSRKKGGAGKAASSLSPTRSQQHQQAHQLARKPSGHDIAHANTSGNRGNKHGPVSTPDIVLLASRIFEEARTQTFPNSGLVCMLEANFVRCFIGDPNREMSVVEAGLQRDASIDVRFLLLQSKRQLEEGAGGNGEPPSVMCSLLYGKHGAHGASHGGGGGKHQAGGARGHGPAAPSDHGAASNGTASSGPTNAADASGAGKLSVIERVQYEQFFAEAAEQGMIARQKELEFWSELRKGAKKAAQGSNGGDATVSAGAASKPPASGAAPSDTEGPNFAVLHECSESMSTAITKANDAFAKLLALRPDSVEVLQSYAVFLLEVRREVAAADRFFDRADDIMGLKSGLLVLGSPAAPAVAADSPGKARRSLAPSPTMTVGAGGTSRGGPAAAQDGDLLLFSSPATPASGLRRRNAASSSPVHSPAPSPLSTASSPSKSPGQRRRRSRTGSNFSLRDAPSTPAAASGGEAASGARSRRGSIDIMTNHAASLSRRRRASRSSVGPEMNLLSPAEASHLSPNAGGFRPSPHHDDDAAIGVSFADSPVHYSRQRGGAASAQPAKGMRKLLSREELAVIIRGQVSGRRDEPDERDERQTGGDDRSSGKRRGRAQTGKSPRATSARGKASRGGGNNETDLYQLALRQGPLAVEEEVFTQRETARTARLQNVAEAKRQEAKRRKADDDEAAANSLRLAIKQQAKQMEPAIGRLWWILSGLFVLAAVLTVAMLALEDSLISTYMGASSSIVTAGHRQRTIELCVDSAFMITRYGDGILDVSIYEANATAAALAQYAKDFDHSHSALFSAMSSFSIPEEVSSYSASVWPIWDFSDDAAAYYRDHGNLEGLSIGTASNSSITTRTGSLATMAAEFVAKANVLAALYPLNVTSASTSALWLVHNGINALRPAANVSMNFIGKRMASMELHIALVTLALSSLNVSLFALGFALVLLPFLVAVRRSTDKVFRIFLCIPDDVIATIQKQCGSQIETLLTVAEEGQADEEAIADDYIAATQATAPLPHSHRPLHSAASARRPLSSSRRPRSGQGQEMVLVPLLARPGDVDASSLSSSRAALARDGPQQALLVKKISESFLGLRQGTAAAADAESKTQATAATISTRAPDSSRSDANIEGGSFVAAVNGDEEGLMTVVSVASPSSRIQSVPSLRLTSTPLVSSAAEPEPATKTAVATAAAAPAAPKPPSASPSSSPSFCCHRRNYCKDLSAGLRLSLCCCCRRGGLSSAAKANAAMTAKDLSRFSWPFLLITIFFAAMWAFQVASLAFAASHRASASAFGNVRVAMWKVHTSFTQKFYDLPGLTTLLAPSNAGLYFSLPRNFSDYAGASPTLLDADANALAAAAASELQAIQDAAIFGGGVVENPLSGDDWLSQVMLRNACNLPSVPTTQCASPSTTSRGFFDGLMENGILAALREFPSSWVSAFRRRAKAVAGLQTTVSPSPTLLNSNTSSQLLAAVDSSLATLFFYHQGQRFGQGSSGYAQAPNVDLAFSAALTDTSSPSFAPLATGADLRKLALWYLDPALEDVQQHIVTEKVQNSDLAVYSTVMVGGGIMLLLVLFCCWLYLTRKALAKMDGDVKRTRSVLLLFPPAVLADVAAYLQRDPSDGRSFMMIGSGDRDGGDSEDDSVVGHAASNKKQAKVTLHAMAEASARRKELKKKKVSGAKGENERIAPSPSQGVAAARR